MGNSCSSGQAHKDKDDASQHSEESPSYRLTKPDAETEQPPPRAPPPVHPPARHVPATLTGTDSMSLPSPAGRDSPSPPAGPPAPPAVAALPEDLRAVLLGHTASAPPRRRRHSAVIIYVCAADSQDCCSEKGALQCGAALRLRVRARRRGWRLHVADLHWRSPLEQQRDHRFPILCTAELARQSSLGALVPVVFLNAGLGTPLLPHTLEAADFRAALVAAADDDERALLNKWYTLDSDAEPACYRLARGAPARWRREMARALAVLVRALPQEACDAYLTTVVEQEVHHTVLMSTELSRRCVWVCRAGGVPDAADSTEPSDPAGQHELQRRLAKLQHDLKQHLCERNIIRASVRGARGGADGGSYAAGVRAALGERLDALLDALVAEHAAPAGHGGVPAPLLDELAEHAAFCQRAAQTASAGELALAEIKAYVTGDGAVPLVVLGGAGAGKATLLARAVTLAPLWRPGAVVVVRFVGLTPQSSTSLRLLKSIVDQLSVIVTGAVHRGPCEAGALGAELSRLLEAAGRVRPVLVALAGADLLRGARWLPSALPHNVRAVVTVTEEADEPSSSAVLAVLKSERGPRVLRAPAPGADEARAMLAACAASHPRAAALQPGQRAQDAVAANTAPLYAKIVAWQASLSSETFCEEGAEGGEAGEELPELVPAAAGLDAALAHVLHTSERALGAARVRHALALLCAARRGLDDTEMLDLLAHEELFRSEETYLPWAPASLFWPQLAALLGGWLRWDARGAARWRDAALARVAHDRYLADPERERYVRTQLAQYFEGVWFADDDPKMAGRLVSQENRFSHNVYNTRKLDELPWQHSRLAVLDGDSAGASLASKPYFTDLEWVTAKLAATDCAAFLDDVSLVRAEPPPEHVRALAALLETHAHALDYDARQLYPLLRAWLADHPPTGEVCSRWAEEVRSPPVAALFGAPRELEAAEGEGYSLVVRLEPDGRYCAALAPDRDEIAVWDVLENRRVRTLRGVPNPTNLLPIDRHRCVVLCRRELRVLNLDKGEFLVALKGVMNQKMPYYGLHDERHLVALARNRMYVNLMNLETGDCVTTFKAGEDRFLDSLLVSGDGRILVCGDETQKPFPLLVWALSSRKLLYDLRIPHHEFLTHLAAITHEGSYVCVVSRELEQVAPSLIVVYDLQSGTLFKKWKPGVDTTALAISSSEGCVVSALADGSVLVWELLTGNCRATLRGHTAPADLLRLPRAGGALLSGDTRASDPHVRLWDLRTGECVATYTPDGRLRAAEVCMGGSAIALALAGRSSLQVLRLEGPLPDAIVADGGDDGAPFGDPELDGKLFRLDSH